MESIFGRIARVSRYPVLLVFLVSGLLFSIAASAQDLKKLFRKVSGSVVVIYTTQQSLIPQSGGLTKTEGGLGSGVLISKDGKVLTAAHVVQVAEDIQVEFPNGSKVPARVISSVPGADISMLQLERVPKGATIARLGNSDKSEIGEKVFIIGAPYGIAQTLTVGYLSARHKPDKLVGGFVQAELLQTDAAINQGNSGGPMFNMKGEVIGIASHILTQSGGFEGLGFVVSSNTARKLLMEEGAPWTGVDGQFISGDIAKILNLPQKAGILVQSVAKSSMAARSGIRGGSYIAEIGGQKIILGGDIILTVGNISVRNVTSLGDIRKVLGNMKEKSELTITILRGGKVIPMLIAPIN